MKTLVDKVVTDLNNYKKTLLGIDYLTHIIQNMGGGNIYLKCPYGDFNITDAVGTFDVNTVAVSFRISKYDYNHITGKKEKDYYVMEISNITQLVQRPKNYNTIVVPLKDIVEKDLKIPESSPFDFIRNLQNGKIFEPSSDGKSEFVTFLKETLEPSIKEIDSDFELDIVGVGKLLYRFNFEGKKYLITVSTDVNSSEKSDITYSLDDVGMVNRFNICIKEFVEGEYSLALNFGYYFDEEVEEKPNWSINILDSLTKIINENKNIRQEENKTIQKLIAIVKDKKQEVNLIKNQNRLITSLKSTPNEFKIGIDLGCGFYTILVRNTENDKTTVTATYFKDGDEDIEEILEFEDFDGVSAWLLNTLDKFK